MVSRILYFSLVKYDSFLPDLKTGLGKKKLTNGFLMNVWRFWQIGGCHSAKIIMLKFLKFSVLYNRIECIYVAVCSVGALNVVLVFSFHA